MRHELWPLFPFLICGLWRIRWRLVSAPECWNGSLCSNNYWNSFIPLDLTYLSGGEPFWCIVLVFLHRAIFWLHKSSNWINATLYVSRKNLKISLIKFCNCQCDFERQLCYDLIIWIHGIIQVTRSHKAMVPFLSKSLSALPKVLKTIVLSSASERATITVETSSG